MDWLINLFEYLGNYNAGSKRLFWIRIIPESRTNIFANDRSNEINVQKNKFHAEKNPFSSVHTDPVGRIHTAVPGSAPQSVIRIYTAVPGSAAQSVRFTQTRGL